MTATATATATATRTARQLNAAAAKAAKPEALRVALDAAEAFLAAYTVRELTGHDSNLYHAHNRFTGHALHIGAHRIGIGWAAHAQAAAELIADSWTTRR